MSAHAPGPPSEEPPAPRPLRVLHRAEALLVNLVFAVMVALPVIEIVLRRIKGQGFQGSATIVQHLTLWAAFGGAMIAARDRRHLSLSTAEVLPERARKIAAVFTMAVSAAVCGLLTYASVLVVHVEMESHRKLIGEVPYWWALVIMPFGLAVMAARFAWRASPGWIGRILAFVAIGAGFAVGKLEPFAEHLVWPLSIVILLALLAGAPIFVAMSGLAMAFFFSESTPIASVPTETLRLVISPTLPAIPLLTAAGFLLAEGGAARRLVRVYRAFFGWIPGGLAIMVCAVCAIFTAFTGGSGVTILALGGLVYPILIEEKYPEGFSLGLVTASGSLGLLFPPSLPVILYGVVAQIQDFNKLYIAGLVPGALMILMVCAYGLWVGLRRGVAKEPFVASEAGKALWEAKWELFLPVVVAAVILGGFATIVEAAALACAYAVVCEVAIFKDITPKELPSTVAHGAVLVGAVLMVLGMALGLTSYMVDAEIHLKIIAWVRAHIETQWGFLLALNLMLLVIGSVAEIYAAIVILAPLVAPLGKEYGVNEIHLAIVFLANLELGFLFPPVGLNLFLSASRFDKPLTSLYKHAFPFLAIMAAAVLLVTYVPSMTLGVLHLFGHSSVVPTEVGPGGGP